MSAYQASFMGKVVLLGFVICLHTSVVLFA